MNTTATTTVTPSTQTPNSRSHGRPRKRSSPPTSSPHRAVGGRDTPTPSPPTSRHEPLSQLQLWNIWRSHGRSRTQPALLAVCVEPAWPQGEEGRRASAFLLPSSAFKRKKDEEAEKDITKQNTPSWLASAMPTSSMSQTEGASFPNASESRATWARTATVLFRSSKPRASSLSSREASPPRLGMSYGGRSPSFPDSRSRGVQHACP
jgi:hypothetical protein